MDALANAVKVTLGPRGRNVAIERKWGSPTVTKDGVTVAEEIDLPSKIENLGARLVKEVAVQTNERIGDGTTTATVLTQAIYREGLKLVEAGLDGMSIKRGLDKALAAAREALKKQSKKAATTEEVASIGTVSANGDEKVGQILADAFEKVGKDGIITVGESQSIETTVTVVEGMQFDRGYISPYFITDQDRLIAELKNPFILVVERKLFAVNDIVATLELVKKANGSLLVIAEDIEKEALAALTVNKLRGVVQCAAVKSPGFGERRKEILKDIAAAVGATVFTDELGRKLDQVRKEDLGRCDKVILEKEVCKIIKGAGKPEDVKARVNQIEHEKAKTNSTYDKDKLNERLARLSGGVAIVKVGGATETEVRGKRHLIEDALSSTRAAIKEGYVPGGGVALLRARKGIEPLLKELEGDERAGAKLCSTLAPRRCAKSPPMQAWTLQLSSTRSPTAKVRSVTTHRPWTTATWFKLGSSIRYALWTPHSRSLRAWQA